MTSTRTIRFRPRKPAVPPPALVQPADVYQRDDGMYQLGIGDDAPGPFETRAFAAGCLAAPTSTSTSGAAMIDRTRRQFVIMVGSALVTVIVTSLAFAAIGAAPHRAKCIPIRERRSRLSWEQCP
jgi:hypothetical protein